MGESVIPSSMTVPRFLPGGQIDFVEKPVPRPGTGELLLRVKANARCRSELGQYRNGTDVTLGHEAVGVVAAAGPDTATPVGTLGAVFLMDYCDECRSCRKGLTNQCLAKCADYGFNRDGGYGAYELVSEVAEVWQAGTSTTPTGSSSGRSTGMPTRCWRHFAVASPLRFTPGLAAARWRSPSPR